jgi:hypothetical protein
LEQESRDIKTMNPETKRKIQLGLAVVIAVAAIRAGYIVYQRYSERAEEAAQAEKKKAPPLDPDSYVVPKKLYPTDLKSAKQLTKQPVWVREGYHHTYYPFDLVRGRTDFSHEAGMLLPLQKLEIKNVVSDTAPHSAQVMAVFEQGGKPFALSIGSINGNSYSIYSDYFFFIEDPHELYKHWPQDVWEAIDQHQVKPGMNELQVDFAVGMGVLDRSSDSAVKVAHYPNGGKPLTVTYRNGKAAEIRQGE